MYTDMSQISIQSERTHVRGTVVEKVENEEGSYWVQSFNPKKTQLYCKVTLLPLWNIITCTCDYFKFSGGKYVCKHISRVVALEATGSALEL